MLPASCTLSPPSKAGGSAATAATAAATAAITVSVATAATAAATATASATASSSAAAAAVRALKPFGRTTAIEGRRLRHGHDGGSDIDARLAAATSAPAPGVPSLFSSTGQSPCGQKRSLGVYDGCVRRAALAAARRTP